MESGDQFGQHVVGVTLAWGEGEGNNVEFGYVHDGGI